MKNSQPTARRNSRKIFYFHKIWKRIPLIVVIIVSMFSLSSAEAAGFLVLLMSRSYVGGESNAQSDYASIAYGGQSPTDPFPPMVFTSYSTDFLADPSAPEAEGMIEGNGTPVDQQYDVFVRDEFNGFTKLISRTRSEGVDGESVLASVGVSDENLVVFQSSSTNLRSTITDTNNYTDIYLSNLYDLDGDPILVSADGSGIQGGNNHSGNTLDNGLTEKIEGGIRTILTDWHKPAFVYQAYADNEPHIYVIFESKATNLNTVGASNGKKQIFRRDVTSEKTIEISLNKDGAEGNADSWQPAASIIDNEEAHYIVFVSNATNLADVNNDGLIDASDDTNGKSDIFMKNTWTNEIALISRHWDCSSLPCQGGSQGNGDSSYPSFSKDGRYIVFQSKSSNLVDNDNLPGGKNFTDIFLYDTQATTDPLRLISVSSDLPGENTGDPDIPGVQGNLASYNPVVVSSGGAGAQVVVFTSYATNLIDGDTNDYCNYYIEGEHITNCPDIFVHDMIRKQTWRVSLTEDGQESRGSSGWPSLSGNGRFVYFTSISKLLGDGEYTGRRQIFLRDQGNPPGNPNLQPTSWIFEDVNLLQDGERPKRRFRIVAMAPIQILSLHLKFGRDFRILSEDCTNNGAGRWLDDGEECTFEAEFSPKTSGPLWDRVQIDLHDENPGMSDRTIEARLQGTSVYILFLPIVFWQ